MEIEGEIISLSQIHEIIKRHRSLVYLSDYPQQKAMLYKKLNMLDEIMSECGMLAISSEEIKRKAFEEAKAQILEDSEEIKRKAFERRKCQSKNERTVENAIKQLGYTPYHNVIKRDCIGKSRPLPFDFGILVNGKELLIEFDGEHHEMEIRFFGGEEKATEVKTYDMIKTEYCKEKNIPLLRLNKRSSILKEVAEFIKQYEAS